MQILNADQRRVRISLLTAARDMEAAVALVQVSPHLYETIGFHCQQAVEKYLKAALVAFGLPSPFTHDLTRLLDLLQSAQRVPVDLLDVQQAAILNEFAVDLRYDIAEAPDLTAADLLAMAQRFEAKLRPLALAFLA